MERIGTNAKAAARCERDGRPLRAAPVALLLFALSLLALPPAATYAVGATVASPAVQTSAPVRHAGLFDVPTPALTPGLPPPQMSALSDRRIVAGVILVLFAGLAGLTLSMWRELGRWMRL